MKHYKRVLTIAGSDSSGGAGIQADIKTFSALGCFGMTAVTALTAQNTQSVQGIYEVPPDFVADQIKAVLDDVGVDAVKIGMLHSPEIIDTVADLLVSYSINHVVVDPVMYAKSGDRLTQDDAVHALKERLIPLATVLTPNLPEAEALLDCSVSSRSEIETVAVRLLQSGPDVVVIKGGHGNETESDDCLVIREETGSSTEWLNHERIDTSNRHGAGCTFASAITAYLAHGENPPQAIRRAKQYVSSAIAVGSGFQLGKGNGPVAHFYQWWEDMR